MATYKSIKYLVPVEAVEHTDSINALNDVDTVTAAPTDGQTIKWNGTNWVPSDITEEEASGTQKALFGFGEAAGYSIVSTTNLVSSTGVVAADTTGVGTARGQLAAAGFGGDKAIFGFGYNSSYTQTNLSNLVSNTGVVATDSTGVGTAGMALAAAGYGGDKAIFGFRFITGNGTSNVSNLVSNTGVVATDTANASGVTARGTLAAAGFGGDKAIFGFGFDSSGLTNVTNLVSSLGVVATDTTGVGTARSNLSAAGYGGDKAIFGFGDIDSYGGSPTNVTNLVSNAGVVATDTTGVGSARIDLAGAGYSSTA